MKIQVLTALAVGVCLGAQADTWTVNYYGDAAFFGNGGTVVQTNGVNVNAAQLRFPKERTDWSAMCVTHAKIARAGAYAFVAKPGPQNVMALRTTVSGVWTDERANGMVELPAGDAEIVVYARPTAKMLHALPIAMFTMDAPAGVTLETRPEDARREAVDLGTEFTWDDGELRFWEYRSFKWTAPESGIYAFILHGRSFPQFTKLWMDGAALYESSVKNAHVDTRMAYWGDADRAGHPRQVKVDYLGCQRVVRWIEKGEHAVDVQCSPHHYLFETHAEDFWRDGFRFGVKKLDGRNPGRDTEFTLEGVQAMVFRAGEKVTLCARSASAEKCNYTLEFSDGVIPIGGGVPTPFKTVPFAVVGSEPTRLDLCTDREGAFVYTVRDAKGNVASGPWSYAVVDTRRKGQGEGPRRTKESSSSAVRLEPSTSPCLIVDSVDCTEEPGGPHDFRDNDGSSSVVSTPDGPYRLTGLKPLRWNHYTETKDRKGLVPDPTKKSPIKFAVNDWFAYTLKVKHPGRTHVVKCLVPNDVKRQVIVYAIDRKTGQSNGWCLQAGEAPAAGPWSELNFFVWPNADAIDVIVVNSEGFLGSKDPRAGAVKSIALVEYPDGVPPLEKPFAGWSAEAEYGWEGEQTDIGPNERNMPPNAYETNWVSVVGFVKGRNKFRDWNDFLVTWNRFGETSAYQGDNLLIYPAYSYDQLSFQGPATREITQGHDCYFGGPGSGSTDPLGRDIFALMLLEGEKHGVRIAMDLMIQRVYPNFVQTWINKYAPGSDPRDVLLRTTAGGKPFMTFSGAPIPNPAHPAFRRAFVRFFELIGERYGKYPAFAGVRTRFWPDWSASFEGWYHNRELGYDDYSVAAFGRAKGVKLAPVGTNETAFAARKQLINKDYLKEFEDWKCETCLSLREEALAALRKHAPEARLFVTRSVDYTCTRERGLDPDKLRARRDLGFLDEQYTVKDCAGIEWNWPDPQCYANFNRRPAPYGNPPLDKYPRAAVGTYPMGFNCIGGYRSSPYHLEKPAKMLAENRLKRLYAGGPWCPPPADEALRRFVRAWRAIPQDADWRLCDAAKGGPVAVWCDSKGRFFAVNTTDAKREVRVTYAKAFAKAVDQVDGRTLAGKDSVGFALDPYQVAYWTVEGGGAIASVTVPFADGEKATLMRDYGALLAMENASAGIVEYLPMSGETLYANCRHLGQADRAFRFGDLIAPMKSAERKGDLHRLRSLVQDFRRNHVFWYEAFGWPEDFCLVRKVGRWPLKEAMHSANGVGIENRAVCAAETLEPWHETFVTVKRGDALHLAFNELPGGYRRLAFRGLFGGGYGPVRVEFDGRVVGELPVTGKVPRLETRVFAVPLKWATHHGEVKLTGLGEKGLALTDCDVEPLPSVPATKGWVLGPFDHGGGATLLTTSPDVDRGFPVESNRIDLAETFVGIGGKTIGWRTFDNGVGRVIDVDKLTPSDLSQGNATTYLLVRVRNRTKGFVTTRLFFTDDYFGAIFVNGKAVVPKLRGPINSYDSLNVTLKPGVNDILVRTAPGSAGTWYAGLALYLNDDLEYDIPTPDKGGGSGSDPLNPAHGP